MKPEKSLVAKYERLTPGNLRKATRRFAQEMVIDTSRPLTADEQEAWETARRRRDRRPLRG
jgi:hypothetical protein